MKMAAWPSGRENDDDGGQREGQRKASVRLREGECNCANIIKLCSG